MRRKFSLCISFFAAGALFFASCGLDSISIIEAPTTVVHETVYTNSDFAANYIEFNTYNHENDVKAGNTVLGTAVYYKIYADVSTMQSHKSEISALNNSTDYSSAAAKMIGYGYKQLNTSDGNVQPLIGIDGDVYLYGARVKIRLCNYGAEADSNNEYRAIIQITDSKTQVTTTKFPRRSVTFGGTPKTFDFGRYNNPKYNADLNSLPAETDEDYVKGTVSNNKYYVNLYAVAVGRDNTYTSYYSKVLHIGEVPIDSSAENN